MTAVFVPKLKRIYYIGGRNYNFNGIPFPWHNTISYIDLTPVFISRDGNESGIKRNNEMWISG